MKMRNSTQASYTTRDGESAYQNARRRAVAIAAFAIAVAGLLACSPVAEAECPDYPAPDSVAVHVAALGASESEIEIRDELVGQLRDVVARRAVADHARLIVVRMGQDVLADPVVLADVDFGFDATGNAELGRQLATSCTDVLIAQVNARLDEVGYAHGSDPFGATAWAAGIFEQFPNQAHRLSLLTDGWAVIDGCNLYRADLSTPARVASTLAGCTSDGRPDLTGVHVAQGGTGLRQGSEADPARLAGLEQLWRAFWSATGATLEIYGPTLVASAPRP